MGPRVISAFPATGKSYAAEHDEQYVDMESSDFGWMQTDKGRERHPRWPHNYIDVIQECLTRKEASDKLLLVSSHPEVRAELAARHIPYHLTYPDVVLRGVYEQRMIDRGSPAALITTIIANWTRMIASCEADEHAASHLVLHGAGSYLTATTPTAHAPMVRFKDDEWVGEHADAYVDAREPGRVHMYGTDHSPDSIRVIARELLELADKAEPNLDEDPRAGRDPEPPPGCPSESYYSTAPPASAEPTTSAGSGASPASTDERSS